MLKYYQIVRDIQVLINLAPLPCAPRPFYFNPAPCALDIFCERSEQLLPAAWALGFHKCAETSAYRSGSTAKYISDAKLCVSYCTAPMKFSF